MDRRTIVIKKYENRRLYDTTNSRYVNLDEVAQAIQDGAEVQVVDASTGEDITRLVLTQIIVENAKAPNSAFPLDVLRQMVVATGRASQEGALKYMKAVFDLYQSAYRMPQQLSPFEFMQNIMAGAHAPAPHSAAPAQEGHEANNSTAQPAERGPQPRPGSAAASSGSEVNELRHRIEELEGLVTRLGSEKRKPQGKAKPRRGSK